MISVAIYGGLCAVGFLCLVIGGIWVIARAIANGDAELFGNDGPKSLAYPVGMAIAGIFVGVFFAVLASTA